MKKCFFLGAILGISASAVDLPTDPATRIRALWAENIRDWQSFREQAALYRVIWRGFGPCNVDDQGLCHPVALMCAAQVHPESGGLFGAYALLQDKWEAVDRDLSRKSGTARAAGVTYPPNAASAGADFPSAFRTHFESDPEIRQLRWRFDYLKGKLEFSPYADDDELSDQSRFSLTPNDQINAILKAWKESANQTSLRAALQIRQQILSRLQVLAQGNRNLGDGLKLYGKFLRALPFLPPSNRYDDKDAQQAALKSRVRALAQWQELSPPDDRFLSPTATNDSTWDLAFYGFAEIFAHVQFYDDAESRVLQPRVLLRDLDTLLAYGTQKELLQALAAYHAIDSFDQDHGVDKVSDSEAAQEGRLDEIRLELVGFRERQRPLQNNGKIYTAWDVALLFPEKEVLDESNCVSVQAKVQVQNANDQSVLELVVEYGGEKRELSVDPRSLDLHIETPKPTP